MADIPSYEQWMKDTHSLVRPRSEWLKKLDEAIKSKNRDAIKTAFDRWRFEQSKQGKKWQDSVRNEKGAMTNLHRAVSLDKRKLTKEERESLQFISRHQAMALQKQFQGTQLRFKANTIVGAAQGAGTKWQRFKTGAKALKSGGSKANDAYGIASDITKTGGSIQKQITSFCGELCPGVDPNEILNALHLGNVATFASDLAPFVGIVSSGGKAIMGWIGVAKRCWEGIKIADSRYAIAAGDPEAAFDALLVLIDRDIKAEIGRASVSSVAFTGKALGVFCDAGAVTGPAVGLLELLAEIFQLIVEYVRDYRECKVANDLIKVGALNFDLFESCPLLGCYFLVVQDHRTIVSFAVADYGTDNWMFDVEKLMKKLEPVLAKAREYIQLSRLELPGAEKMKGVMEANWSHKSTSDKITGGPGALKDKLASKIDAWFEKPETPPPAVAKSRIVGFGWQNFGRS